VFVRCGPGLKAPKISGHMVQDADLLTKAVPVSCDLVMGETRNEYKILIGKPGVKGSFWRRSID
jgi:hypothetical protein